VDKALYGLFLMLAGGGTFLAGFTAWLHWQLKKADGREHLDHIITKVGIIVTQGVLILRLMQLGTVDVTAWGWAFLAGLGVMDVGLARQVRSLIEKVAESEVK